MSSTRRLPESSLQQHFYRIAYVEVRSKSTWLCYQSLGLNNLGTPYLQVNNTLEPDWIEAVGSTSRARQLITFTRALTAIWFEVADHRWCSHCLGNGIPTHTSSCISIPGTIWNGGQKIIC